MFVIFTWSINTRVKVGGIICALFTIFTVFYLETFLTTQKAFRFKLDGFAAKKSEMQQFSVGSAGYIQKEKELNVLLDASVDETLNILASFNIVQWICMLNLTFFLQHLVTGLYLSKLNRFFSIGSLHLSDMILFCISIYVM